MSDPPSTIAGMTDAPDFSRHPNVTFVQHDTSGSVIYSPGGSADAHLAEAFAAHGLEGSGYDWQSAVHAALLDDPGVLARFGFDSEAGMFCAYGTDLAALDRVAATVEAFLADRAAAERALASAAEHDLFD